MTMRKKDYEAIARMLSAAKANKSHFYASNESDYTCGVCSAAVAIAMYCATQDQTFKRERFLADCGVSQS